MSLAKRIFVTRMLPSEGMKLLEAFSQNNSVQLDVWQDEMPPPRHVLKEKVKGCVGVVSLLTDKIDGEILDAAGAQLKVVSNFAVGYNNVDCDACNQRNVRVGNTPGVLTEATADMAFALLMAAARRLPESIDYARTGKWKTWLPLGFIGQDLHGKTVGVVGMGRIGQAFARRCHKGWNMNVLYHDAFANPNAEKELGAKKVDFETLLRESDIVSVHCNLTPETQGMMNAEAFRKMKKSAIFINSARGPIHDEAALIDACKTNTIFAAGLDVTNPEPPATNSPVFNVPNLVVVPHIASATIQTRNAMASIAAQNLIAGVSGKPLKCEVGETADFHSKKSKL